MGSNCFRILAARYRRLCLYDDMALFSKVGVGERLGGGMQLSLQFREHLFFSSPLQSMLSAFDRLMRQLCNITGCVTTQSCESQVDHCSTIVITARQEFV